MCVEIRTMWMAQSPVYAESTAMSNATQPRPSDAASWSPRGLLAIQIVCVPSEVTFPRAQQARIGPNVKYIKETFGYPKKDIGVGFILTSRYKT